MKVTRILGTSILLLAVATFAYAQPAHRISWDNCDPVVQNKDWIGNSQYKLIGSTFNGDQPNNGHRTIISIGPDVANAWRFDAAGCNAGQMGISYNALDKACLAFQGGQPLGLSLYSYDDVSGKARLDVSNTYDAFTPLIGSRYTLFQATFDHAFSAVGPGDPALVCDFAELPLCFHTVGTELLLVDGTKIPFIIENDWVTWQDPDNNTRCPFATQAQDATWGRVKGLYR
jgi:hypothetical protein